LTFNIIYLSDYLALNKKKMLTIRFNRTGKKNKAQFRIVVQEHTVAPGGRHVEVLGSHDPHSKKSVLKADRIKYWISKGAQTSDSVWNLLVKNGIVEGAKRAVKMKKKPVETEAAIDAKTEEKKEEKAETQVEEKREEAKAKEKPAEKVAPVEEKKEEKIEEPKVE
jgi:small subunit ribosomal protein S16